MEAALERWASLLWDVKAGIRALFTQARVAQSAGLFLDGLLGPKRRKTGWMRAEAAGDPGLWRQQAILGRALWDADALRDVVCAYALEALADPQAVLVIDETGFLKQGKSSCGVGRQYAGSAGKITNYQVGVFAAYVSRHEHAFIDRQLHLPRAWADDAARRAAAQVPSEVAFATKPRMAVQVIGRAIAAGVPFAWVAADSVYGVGEVEMALRRAGKGYVLGWAPPASSTHGGPSRWSSERPRGLLKASALQPGSACPQVEAPRAHACMTGPTLSWLTCKRTSSTRLCPVSGRVGCSSGAASATASMHTSPPGARLAQASKPWWPLKATAGRKPSSFRRLCRWNTAKGHRGQL